MKQVWYYLMAGVWLFMSLHSCDKNQQALPDEEEEEAVEKQWENLGLEGIQVNAITVHPDDPDLLFAGHSRIGAELFKSTDNGQIWDTVFSGIGGGPLKIVFNPSDTDIIYANVSLLCRSMDRGESWEPPPGVFEYHPPQGPYLTCLAFAIDPVDPKRIYVSFHGSPAGPSSLYYTEDGGNSFNFIVHQLFGSIQFYTEDPEMMFAISQGHLFKSVDRGMNWEDITYREFECKYSSPHYVFFSPDYEDIYVYMLAGPPADWYFQLVKSDLDLGEWQEIPLPEHIKEYHSAGFDTRFVFNENEKLIMGTHDGIYKFTGSEWLDYTDDLPSRSIFALAAGDDNQIYVGLDSGIYVRRIE